MTSSRAASVFIPSQPLSVSLFGRSDSGILGLPEVSITVLNQNETTKPKG